MDTLPPGSKIKYKLLPLLDKEHIYISEVKCIRSMYGHIGSKKCTS